MNLKSISISVVSLAAIFVLGILLFNFVIMPMLIHQRESVIVPDIRNVSEAQARNELEGLGLNMRVQRSEHHPETPEGFVIEQRHQPFQ